jgi:hypothetical protein
VSFISLLDYDREQSAEKDINGCDCVFLCCLY